MKASGLLVAAALAAVSFGCSKKEDTIISAADRVSVTDADIDRDPLALLPGGAVGIARVDVPAVFQSAFGQRLRVLLDSRIPLPPGAGFDPGRDLAALFVGVYSMQGADFAAVARGRFDRAAIERAADGTTMTPLGAPLVKTTYAKRTLYVSRNVGFVVLTDSTVLLGNETGIRRALDRLTEGRAAHDLPRWMDDVLTTAGAPLAAGFDLAGQAPVEAAVRNAPFLKGLRTARVVGNFQPPGMNLAGSLTYPDPAAAQAGAASLEQTNQMLRSYSFFMQLAGIGNPIQSLQAVPNGNETQFVVAVDGKAVEWLLQMLGDRLGVSRTTVPATTSSSPILIR